jgi:hypothetical protein
MTSGVFGGGFAAEFRLVGHAVDVKVEGWVRLLRRGGGAVAATTAVMGMMMPKAGSGFDYGRVVGVCEGRRDDEL